MARTVAELPAGSRITDYISLGVMAKFFPLEKVRKALKETGRESIRERDLPQETKQDHALNFTKGCYIGQEIVERIRSRGTVHRMFTGFSLSAPVSKGAKVIDPSGKEVGEITSVATISVEGAQKQIALGYIRREAAGGELRVGEVSATVTALPFKF